MAAGFEFHIDQISHIVGELKNYCLDEKNKVYLDEITFDAKARVIDFQPKAMHWIQAIGPYGQSFEAPLFCLSGVTVTQSRNLKGGHLKLTLQDDLSTPSIYGLLFSPSRLQLDVLQDHSVIDILVEPQWNYYQNQRTVQLLIKELRAPCTSLRTIEITRRNYEKEKSPVQENHCPVEL